MAPASIGPEVSSFRHSLVACCDVEGRIGAVKSARNAISSLHNIVKVTLAHHLGVHCSGTLSQTRFQTRCVQGLPCKSSQYRKMASGLCLTPTGKRRLHMNL